MPSLLIVGDPVGSHAQQAIEYGWDPSEITVCETNSRFAYAVQCIHAKIEVILDDDSLSKLDKLIEKKMKFTTVIGNPPYGSGGNLAIKFINKCTQLSDDVRLVLPLSVRKPSSLNKIRLDIECTYDEELPEDTFPKGISTVLQHWSPTDTPREKIFTYRTHPHFDFVKKSNSPDLMIFRCGASTGKIRYPGEFDNNKEDHYYIRVSSDEVKKNLESISDALVELSTVQNGRPGISKHELIETYVDRYGS